VFLDILYLLTVLALLVTSAFFAACETAITAFSKPRMHRLAKDGDERASIICKLQNEIELVISTILTCNTITNSLAVSFATAICIEMLGQAAVLYGSIILSVFIVLFAEVLPKMFTITNPEKILLPSANFIRFTFVTLRPINNIIGAIAKWFISVFTKTVISGDEYASSIEELKGAIDMHMGSNTDDTAQEKAMLSSILDLGSVQVNKIMVHRKNVTMICLDDAMSSIIDQIILCPFTRIPLWMGDRDNIVGVLYVKTLLKSLRDNNKLENLDLLSMAIKPWFIPESTDLLYQLQEFRKRKEHFALVVDEYGCFMGVVTLEDILEEIVGEISDEHDVAPTSEIRKQDDESYIVDGSVSIRDFNRDVGTSFPGYIATTIAGLVINSTGIIPNIGQVFLLFGYRFEILKRRRNQVTLLKISKLEEDSEQ
jgi:Mg2+/Co2+ transporter CorB